MNRFDTDMVHLWSDVEIRKHNDALVNISDIASNSLLEEEELQEVCQVARKVSAVHDAVPCALDVSQF